MFSETRADSLSWATVKPDGTERLALKAEKERVSRNINDVSPPLGRMA